jgi:hypothetical protein
MYKSGPECVWKRKKKAIVCNGIANRLFISQSENCTLKFELTASKLAYDWT